jgi:hypothetical protein
MTISAGMILDTISAAVVALFYMAAKISCAAVDNIRYDLALLGPKGI